MEVILFVIIYIAVEIWAEKMEWYKLPVIAKRSIWILSGLVLLFALKACS